MLRVFTRKRLVFVSYSVLTLLGLYGIPWLVWGQPTYSTETLHPILVFCAIVAAYNGVAGGLAALVLALVPFAFFDLGPREIDASFQSYSLNVLFWPALTAIAVLFVGSIRDLQEKRLAEALSRIETLEREEEALQRVADAALTALRQNEVQIATRHEVSPLTVLEALEQLSLGGIADFEQDFAHLVRLIAPDADFALLSDNGDAVSASSDVEECTLNQMRKILPNVAGEQATSCQVDGPASDGKMVAACPVSGETGLAICVSYSTHSAIEDLVKYLPQFAKRIEMQAQMLSPGNGKRSHIRAIA